MSTPNWMPLDIDDYLADTMHLSAAEHGAYMLLIMRYWKDGGLPADEKMIARYSRLTPDQWAESRDVLAAFFDAGWRHRRIDAELAKAADIIAKRKSAAGQRHGKSNAHAEQEESKSTYAGVPPLPLPSPSEDKPLAQQPVAAALRDETDVLDRLLAAAGVQGNPPTGLAFPGEILGLIDAGFDLDRDILPAIRAKPNPRARTWSYFLPQIREAAARRSSAAATPPPVEPATDWRGRVEVFRAGGVWSHSWGPKPDEAGCKVPTELLQDHAA